MKEPLVSVGMPVYNGGRFVREAIESVLAQTFPDFELVVCDNASTDETEQIVRECAARDARIRYERGTTNRGAVYNYHRVTQLSRGRYIHRAAHDDVLAPTNLERCVAVLEADPGIALAYPQMCRIDEDGRPIDVHSGSLILDDPDPVVRWKQFLTRIDESSMCDSVFGLFRADVLRATPVRRNVIGAEMLLLADVALCGRIAEIPEKLFFERWHAGTSVNAKRDVLNAVPYWRCLTSHGRSIAAAPLTPAQRAACIAALGSWMLRSKRGLVLRPLALVTRLAELHGAVARFDRALLGVE